MTNAKPMDLNERTGWADIRARIHGMIVDGTFARGEKLPLDRDLAERFGCARGTVQRAMADLAESGIVERRRKGGTRVVEAPATRAIVEIPVVRREVERTGAVYGYRLIARRVQTPPASVAAIVMPEIDAGEMLRVQALHLSDEEVYSFEDRWISVTTVPEILDVDLATESANAWLVANRPYDRCDVAISAMPADRRLAAAMALTAGTALLTVERRTWIGARAITYVRVFHAPGYRLTSRG